MKFYKGESISIVFTAYDNNKKLINISGYTKEITLFTPFSSKIVKGVTAIDNNSFRVEITAAETSSLEHEGCFNIILSLKKGTEVKIGKSIPCELLDIESSGCNHSGRLSIDNRTINVDMGIDSNSINFEMNFGNAINMIGGTEADAYIKEAVKDKADKKEFFNVSQLRAKYNYSDKKAAREDVPDYLRALGQVIIYQLSTGDWIAEQFIAEIANNNLWIADSSWKAFGSGGVLDVSEAQKNYAFESNNAARAAVKLHDRKKGQLIIYKLSGLGWVYEMFVGDDVAAWTNDTKWEQIITSRALQLLSENIDTQFRKVTEEVTKIANRKADNVRLTDDNKLQLTSNGTDIGTPLELPSGIINLSYKNNIEFESGLDARKTVKATDRILGQIITYKLNDGTWILDQFIGESVGSWESEGSWVSYALLRDLSPILTELDLLQGRVENLAKVINTKVDGAYTEDVDETTLDLILTSNGEEIARTAIPKGGGSTGPAGVVMRLRAVGSTSLVVGDDSDAIVQYNWTSIDQETGGDTGEGNVYITVNGMPAYSGVVPQGDNQYNVRDTLNLGANIVRVRLTDGYNNVRTITFSVQKASLILTSTFADDIIYKTSPVTFRYTPIGAGDKKIRFWLNNIELAPEITTASGKQLTRNLTALQSGANSIRVVAESSIDGAQLKSNELFYEFILADTGVTEPVITISYSKIEVSQFEVISIPYLVYDPINAITTVELAIDNIVRQSLQVPRSRQQWGYSAIEQGNFKMEVRCRNVSRSLNISVVASEFDITEEKGDLRYKVSAIGKSNNGADRASWAYGDYDAIFKNFLWAEDGWQKDAAGNNHLRLIGDSSVDIGIKPFNSAVVLNGLTLTIEYATASVTNAAAEIISCMFGGVGIVMTPSSATISSGQSTLSARLDSSTKTSISFVVEKLADNRLMYLFIDGIMSGSMQYPSTDNFAQNTQQGLTINSGGRSCTNMVYSIRWYDNNLNFDQIFGNYIFDIENFNEKIALYQFNNIMDAYGSIDYNKALEFLPCLTFIGELPTIKGTKKDNDILFEDRRAPLNSFTAVGAKNDVQGTSSQFYPRKNFKFTLTNGLTLSETGEHLEMYQLQGKQIPAKIFTMKADFAESSGTHNTGVAILIDEALRKLDYKIPPQGTDDRVRTTIYGFPILVFHKKTASDNSEFVGKYNFNDDKASTQVFGFTPGCECWEFLNNTADRCLFRNADFTGTNWLNDFEGRYPDGHTDATNLSKVITWVYSCIGNPTKFRQELAEHFNVNWLMFYCVMTELYGMVDQRAKNMMLTTYGERGVTGELIWYFIFYDNDTVLGINNEGRIAFEYNIESQDIIGSGHVWNGWNSALWTLVETEYKTELQAMYKRIRENALSANATLEVLQGRQSSKWSETIYNQDGYFKYIAPLTAPNPGSQPNSAYLYALQGSRARHRIWWTQNRFLYLDSKYATGDFLSDYATMRLYTPTTWTGVQPNADFTLTPTKAGYLQIKYGSYATTAVRGSAGTPYVIKAPTGTTFNDTETIIYGISSIKSLGDLAPKYPGTVDITNAVALEELIVGSLTSGYKNNNLTGLHTGTNEMLKKVNVANCPNLQQSLELSKCYSITEVEARGSGITGISLPSSGVLKTMYLPATIASIYIKNQPLLTILSLAGYANITTVVIDNVPSVDSYALVKSCIAAANSKLSRVRIIGINANDSSPSTLAVLSRLSGEDENGNPTETAVVTGQLFVSQISQSGLDKFRLLFPQLTITAGTIIDVIDFEDSIVKNLVVTKWDTNGDGEISSSEVTNAVIPTGMLTGTGAKLFNELTYFKGGVSNITDINTLEEVSINPRYAVLRDLPNLQRLTIGSEGESLIDTPSLNYNVVTNTYEVPTIVVRGRYYENSRGGFILAKQQSNTGEDYYRAVLPLRGHSAVVIDEKIVMHINDFKNSTYPWGSSLISLTLNNVRNFTLPYFQSLNSLTIRGFSETVNDVVIGRNPLNTLIIDDTTGNPLTTFAITSITLASLTVTRLTCNNLSGSIFSMLRSDGGTPGILENVDLPATYIPAKISLSAAYGVAVYRNLKLVLRANSVIPLEYNDSAVYQNLTAVYVPDSLVSAYKVATNWSGAGFVNKILPISLLG
ncbi:CotH kinase family protein [Dysgonomonas sp. ZJ279]|uniref:CotH kinase family protein n=1 Tax=Dysgonomonas sp. ZJ279 TaxID=2709796 RepID=UPI0013EA1B87|nr:CotH kinase family protein [Dysgonomonas sp. ZJ279]